MSWCGFRSLAKYDPQIADCKELRAQVLLTAKDGQILVSDGSEVASKDATMHLYIWTSVRNVSSGEGSCRMTRIRLVWRGIQRRRQEGSGTVTRVEYIDILIVGVHGDCVSSRTGRVSHRGAATTAARQMEFSTWGGPEEEIQEAYPVNQMANMPKGIIDDTQPKFDDDRDLGWKEVQVHPEKERLSESAKLELKQWENMKVDVFPSEEGLEQVLRNGERILLTRMVYKCGDETVTRSDKVALEWFVKYKARCVGFPEV